MPKTLLDAVLNLEVRQKISLQTISLQDACEADPVMRAAVLRTAVSMIRLEGHTSLADRIEESMRIPLRRSFPKRSWL